MTISELKNYRNEKLAITIHTGKKYI